ncbi:MAG: HtaA domain-containing protein [Actinomadura sp.]
MSSRRDTALTYPDGEVTLEDPTVVIGPADAALRLTVDVRSADPARAADQGDRAEQAEIGDLKTFGIAPETVRRTVTWTEVPVTLTAAGGSSLDGSAARAVATAWRRPGAP